MRIFFVRSLIAASSLYITAYTTLVCEDFKTPPTIEFSSSEKLIHRKMSCLMLVFSNNETLLNLAKNLQQDLEFTDQLDVEVKKTTADIQQKVFSKLFDNGYALTLYMQDAGKNRIKLAVKDTQTQETYFEETMPYTPTALIQSSHEIASKVMPALTNETPPYLTKIAYCKQLDSKHKIICVNDLSGKCERPIITAPTLNVAPRWHSSQPTLYFSQFTRDKARLMSLQLETNKQKVICSYDGLNMQPSFSSDGSQVALCLSAKDGNTEIFLYDQKLCKALKKRVFKQITHNQGNNTSPSLLPNGDVVFCSDFSTGTTPQIYYLDTAKNESRQLSKGKAYCAAPSYCEKTNSIVYTKLCNNVFQLFSQSLSDKFGIEQQLTYDAGDKVDPSYSPCGKYVAFTFDKKNEESGRKIPQIAVLNTSSKKLRVLTTGNQPKSFPAWSSLAII